MSEKDPFGPADDSNHVVDHSHSGASRETFEDVTADLVGHDEPLPEAEATGESTPANEIEHEVDDPESIDTTDELDEDVMGHEDVDADPDEPDDEDA